MCLKAIFISVFAMIAVAPAIGQPSNKRMLAVDSKRTARAPAVKTARLAAIRILKHDTESEWPEKTFDGKRGPVFSLDLELGESIENQMIELHPVAGDSRAFKIEQQFETSVAIGDEGPHLDLVNWRHYTSEWSEIERLSDTRFLTSKIHESDTTRFPRVTTVEIYRVALKEGGRRWANLARKCRNLTDGPCYVGVSRISFRISANENGDWKEIHRINVSLPLGC